MFAETANLASLAIGDLVFQGNEITSTTGQDIQLYGSGVGGVVIENLKIVGSVVTNVVSDAITELKSTDNGYFKIAGTNGFVPPKGTELQRPTAYAVIGMTRYNTNSKALEVFDGVGWTSPSGTAGAVSAEVAEETALKFALTLG